MAARLTRICFVIEASPSAALVSACRLYATLVMDAVLDQGTAAMSSFWRDMRMHCLDPILRDLGARVSQAGEVPKPSYEASPMPQRGACSSTRLKAMKRQACHGCAAGTGDLRVAHSLEPVSPGALRLDAGPSPVQAVAGRHCALGWRTHAAAAGR